MSTGILDPNTINITGLGAYADLRPILVNDGITMTESMTQASTVDVIVADIPGPDGLRPLLQSSILASEQPVTCSLDNYPFMLCKVAKSGSILTLTFEADVIHQLRMMVTPYKAAAGTMSRVEFCTHLANQGNGINVVAAPDPEPSQQTLELAQGTFDNEAASGEKKDDPENAWDAMNRIMGEIGWRVFHRPPYEIVIAPDSWLITQGSPTLITEFEDGIDEIDFDWDVGKPVSEATFTCRAGFNDIQLGSVVTIGGMGPASAKPWLVKEIHRKGFSLQTEVTLIRQQPELAEPGAGTTASGAPTAGGGTAGTGDTGGGG